MADQIVLAWTVNVAGSSFGPVQAATALSSVQLYDSGDADPVLGQFFGLTVASDITTNDATSATRTITLNMNNAGGAPTAPPPFPCHPNRTEPPLPPYPLTENVTLAGSFFVSDGSAVVLTSAPQSPALSVGSLIRFLAQPEETFEVAIIGATSITLSSPYSGVSGNTTAFKVVPAPVALDRLAIYSTSELDTNGVATTPAIPAGSGARSVEVQYMDSTGAGPFEAEANLTGKRPVTFVFDAPPGIDVAEIVNIVVSGYGAFGNSIGQLTLVELSDALPAIPPGTIPGTGVGSIEGTSEAIGIMNTFVQFTDQAQGLIERSLVYLPPSYFALAAPQASQPPLTGDFLVTTGSASVATTEDQTGALAAGNFIEFASQPKTLYEIASVTDALLTLTTVYSGFDTGSPPNTTMPSGGQQPGDVKGAAVIEKPTGARLIEPSPAAPPTNTELAGPLGQFVNPGVASPPPNPPLPPGTFPTPTFLSGLFTRTLQLALAGVPITPATISFLP